MPSRQGIATDQLMNVIQVLQLGRKTGELRAERQVGSQTEEGLIKFVYGHVTFAQCGQLDGQTALHWLKSWGQCRFVFTNVAVKTDTDPRLQSRQPSAELPAIRQPRQDTAKLPVQRVPQQFSPRQPVPQQSSPRQPMPEQFSPRQQYSPTTEPLSAYATLIPRRMYAANEGMYRLNQANISRLHRHLYLLIDGQRSCAELVRLVNRPPEDVMQLLKDLEHIGIIQFD